MFSFSPVHVYILENVFKCTLLDLCWSSLSSSCRIGCNEIGGGMVMCIHRINVMGFCWFKHTKMRSPSSVRLWDRKITACTLILQVVIILLTRKCWKWPARLCHLCSRICWNFPCLYAPTLQQFKLFNRSVQEMLRWCAEHFTKAQEGGTCGRKHLRV